MWLGKDRLFPSGCIWGHMVDTTLGQLRADFQAAYSQLAAC